MQDDMHSYILQDQVDHLKRQIIYWKKRAEDAEQENKELYDEFVCGEDEV